MGRPPGFDKDEVVQAVERQFRRTGYAGTSVDDIAKAAGLGRGSLYAAFGDKSSLYLRTLEAYCGRIEAAWAAVLEGPDDTALERLHAYLVKSARFVHEDPDGLGCMVTGFVVEGVDHDPQAAARVQQALDRIESSLTGCVRAAQRHGDLDPAADAQGISHLLMAVNRGMEVLARAGSDTAALERVADQTFAGLPLTAQARSRQEHRPGPVASRTP
ncbi:TetR/AcrR family transcriptional regulator (plasmid) [Streptomyces sp. NBC_01340]|uniref:TetR/AcrR family transcriptional regulator n=1 Tax=unclassified Streptomyces TaxID=2593676 RepID=UPI0022560525|nr:MULTISPECIES: TetR/AcrR family transcriptional regulator [unclassified Streptomyces]MCX4460120.1 TetR/AcrR family transcriptional regulator [Streptomyces sp. NBC_01719]MCX4500549.1 TetR/AcrR family transcriptional regulator [Streptomyces sp. NBC_01728]MCX4597626.1 TetR/AcrR family transcriptional regulator [Streptomyces sp. NBC_01549]WSI45568.1 TetR/AcrR family transcriptional regulator [Streptomyces sp. NBC_01340]